MTLQGFYAFDDSTGEPGLTVVDATTGSAGRSAPTGGLRPGGSVATAAMAGSASTVIVGIAHFTAAFGNTNILRFMEGSAVHCGVGVNSAGNITIYGPSGAVVATSSYVHPTSVWIYIEAKAVIADSGGSVEVKVDGTTVVSYTGDTRNANTGVVNNIGLLRTSSTSRMDDMYILDTTGAAPYNTYLGDIAVRLQVPDGNGDASDWVGSDGNSVNNYQQVDEIPSSATDYNAASTAGKTDLYTLSNIPTTDLPLATQVMVYAAKSDAGTPPAMKAVTKGDGGTVREESAVTLSTTYQFFAGAIRTTDPDGDTLSASNVNAMQIGVRSA